MHEAPTNSAPLVLPDDEHNRRLVENVHPPAWTNPQPPGRYHLVVIGAGAAGLVAALGAAGLGARVALVERHLLGGDCLNVGCVPSKALIRSARACAAVREAEQFGVHVPPGMYVDFPAVMERMRRLRAAISPNDSAERCRNLGVDVYFGQARFASRDTIQVDGRTLRFRRAVIATGGRPAAPSIPGLEEAGYLTNETVFSLTELPRRLAVIGAGPIGCELAQAFSRFGSQVWLIEAMHGILPKEDRDAAEMVRQSMLRDGVELLCCGKDLRVARTPQGKRLAFDSHGAHYDIPVDEILLGAGRAPNVEGLDLKTAGVASNPYGVEVNDRLQTTNPKIFAAGDICSRYKFTHAADALARLVVQNALFFGRAKASALVVPWCTYTDPEIAHVGFYEHEAKERGIRTQTFEHRFRDVDRAVLDGETEGLVRVLVRQGTDRIVGATIIGAHAGELISQLSLAMTARKGLGAIAGAIYPYPTHAEAIKKVADAYNRTRLTPRVKAILDRWFAWTQ
jgi:pyruvate/2-oxoglutarate dehydrogenase complex dihydrolipoamide dehydrogenase (E3) component